MQTGDTPLILDFGMHEGEDTEFYLETGADVIAFEANSDLVRRNRKRFAKEIDAGRLRIVEGAIVPPDHAGDTVVFYKDLKKSVWGTTDQNWVERNSGLGSHVERIEVPAVDLAAILKERDAYYVKIDIEGADQDVIATIRSTGTSPAYVSIESEKASFDALVREISVLAELGYTKFAAVQQATIPGRTISGRRFDGSSFRYRFRQHASGPFGQYLDEKQFKSADEIIEEYRGIFARYEKYGDRSWLMTNSLMRLPTKLVNKVGIKAFGRPLCGWYDTHAAL